MFINLSIGPGIFGLPNTIRRLCMYIPLLILIRMNTTLFSNVRKKRGGSFDG